MKESGGGEKGKEGNKGDEGRRRETKGGVHVSSGEYAGLFF
jgi:hypothetical protein